MSSRPGVHVYRGPRNSRAQRQDTKIRRAARPIDLERLEALLREYRAPKDARAVARTRKENI